MCANFLQSEVTVIEVVKEKKPELLADVMKMYSDYKSILEDYCKVVSPLKIRIKQLEVSICFYFYIPCLGRQVRYDLAISARLLFVA
jgi:hypothetical protein